MPSRLRARPLACLLACPLACLLASTITACGSPQAATTAAAAASGTAEPPRPAPSGATSAPVASASAPSPEPTPTPSAPPSATGAIVMDDPSGCTPVATAFEHETHPLLRACYREGKKDDPNLEGTIKILLTFDARGKRTVKSEDITLPKPVATCMTRVIETTPFPEGKRCVGKNLTFPIKFPSR